MRAANRLRFQLLLSVVSLAGAGQELPQASAPALHIQLLHRLRTENLDAEENATGAILK